MSHYVRRLTFNQTYFEELVQTGEWNATKVENKIALLAIYMPILRRLIEGFVHTHNVHMIRKQPNRPYSVHGQPRLNYYYPEYNNASAQDLKTPVDKEWINQ